MLVIQPTLADFIRQCTYDINAPLYYVLARVWAQFSGVSDHALRALPVALGIAAPLIALLSGGLADRATRFTWSAFLACWIPGILFSQEARWYTLAFALSIANASAFIAVLRNPTPVSAWRWTTISSLLILAHYYGAILLAFQGSVYLLIHRRRAIATWPAALAFLPAFGSISVHFSRLIAFTTPATTWIPLVKPTDLLWKVAFIFGGPLMVFLALAWLIVALAMRLLSGSLRDILRVQTDDQVWAASACSLAAAVLVVSVGLFVPMFIDRYLIAFVPGILLGLAKFANVFERRSRISATILAALFFAYAVNWAVFWSRPWRSVHDYNYETASEALISTKPSRLVFLWDNPMRPEPSQLAALGGFFFARAGLRTPVDPVVLSPDQDPNQVLLARASPSGSVILWISDRGVRGTAAIRHRPTIDTLDPAWRCHNFGTWQYRVIACSRDPVWSSRYMDRSPQPRFSSTGLKS
jgi:hypothetical protein